MQKTIITCDHCGAPCRGNVYASLWDEGDETKAYSHTRLDGCSREHLGVVLAKAFGIPIDGNLATLLNDLRILRAEYDEQHRKLTSARAEAKALHEQLALAASEKPMAFGGAETLRRVRERLAAAPGEACEYYAEIIDDELAKLPAAPSLTAPIKPTKPVAGVCDECGGLGVHRPWCKT